MHVSAARTKQRIRVDIKAWEIPTNGAKRDFTNQALGSDRTTSRLYEVLFGQNCCCSSSIRCPHIKRTIPKRLKTNRRVIMSGNAFANTTVSPRQSTTQPQRKFSLFLPTTICRFVLLCHPPWPTILRMETLMF